MLYTIDRLPAYTIPEALLQECVIAEPLKYGVIMVTGAPNSGKGVFTKRLYEELSNVVLVSIISATWYQDNHAEMIDAVKFYREQGVVIVEGMSVINCEELRDLCQLKIYIPCATQILMKRHAKRKYHDEDIQEMERFEKMLTEEFSIAKRMAQKHCDIHIPGKDKSNLLSGPSIPLIVSTFGK
jgi:uridine kinase